MLVWVTVRDSVIVEVTVGPDWATGQKDKITKTLIDKNNRLETWLMMGLISFV